MNFQITLAPTKEIAIGMKIRRLGDVAPPDAVGQEGDDQPEEGASRRHHEQPQDVVEDRLPELVSFTAQT